MSIDKISIEELSIMQLCDSFFPTGMYTMSNGLEALFYSKKKVKDANGLRDLIKVYIEYQIGPADCTALGNSYEYAQGSDLQKLLEVDEMLFSMKLIRETREATTRSGIQLLRCVSSFIFNHEILNKYQKAIKVKQASGVYAVALAVVSSALKIPKRKAGLMMLYAFSVSLVGAALRLGMIQHLEGQRIVHELKPSMLNTVKNNIDRPLTGMWQFVPDIDIIQITHERMGSKMFIT
ncbi:MAG TPA: urease accessory UreF family protein [Nitrososphaeraceae archaeon]|jgi:urease accessory protein|nr:urease accessory UreF family protein [Nitrososphaeraceae archaeon]